MVDMRKMKKDYENKQRGGDWWTPPPGDTLVYIHGQCRPDDKYQPTEGLNYIEVGVHFNVGKAGLIASMDREANPIIEHPYVKKYLKKRKVKVPDKCPIMKAITSGQMSDDEADAARLQNRTLWGVTPLFHRERPSQEWNKLPISPSVSMFGRTIYDGIMNLFFNVGDVTDPDAAILVMISRTGKGKNDTKYTVSAYLEPKKPGSVSKPMKLSGKMLAAINKAMAVDGDCDLFKVVANLFKPAEEVKQVLAGIKIVEDDDDDDIDEEEEGEEDEGEEDEDDEEEGDEDDDEEDEGGDEGEEEEEGEDEEEDGGEEDDEGEDEDEGGEGDEGSDEEEESEDEDEEEEPKKPNRTTDVDDAELDELDAELERLSGKASSNKKPGKKVSKAEKVAKKPGKKPGKKNKK